MNFGEKILLRLRPTGAPDTFLPEEDIIYTMLHEVIFFITDHSLLGAQRTPFRSSHIMYMDPMTRTFTTSYRVSKKNITSSNVPAMQAKASSQMGVDWVLAYPNTFPRLSRGNGRSKPPKEGEGPIPFLGRMAQ